MHKHLDKESKEAIEQLKAEGMSLHDAIHFLLKKKDKVHPLKDSEPKGVKADMSESHHMKDLK